MGGYSLNLDRLASIRAGKRTKEPLSQEILLGGHTDSRSMLSLA